MATKTKVEKYLLSNPIDRALPSPYDQAAQALGVDKEIIRGVWRSLRKRGLVENNYPATNVTSCQTATGVQANYYFKAQGDNATVSKHTDTEVRNEMDLAEVCDIDLSVWTISEWECKRYEAWIKNKEGQIESQPKFSIYAKMKRKKLDSDLSLQKDVILRELFDSAPELQIFEIAIPNDESPAKDCLYEISIPDIHFGKMAWGEETGEDYDLKIACKRFNDAISELLTRINLEKVDRILFPIGNDMINIDNNNNTTTAGTPQSVDGRFPKIIKVVKNLLIENITKLATIAPVDVLVVPGNHDNSTMFLLGEILEAYFNNTEKVTVFNSPKPRKYYRYGVNGFQYTHGNDEKHQELGLIFATEEPLLWASTKFRVCKLGHLHKTKKTHWVSTDEHQGFQVEILPSLSGTDKWHMTKGYMSNKAAKSFLYHKEKGKIAEFTYTL
jgi:hypothetical protein